MILAFTNSKGGVGKSTVAVHLAAWMFEQGKNLVFVDSDVQASSSAWLSEAAPESKTIRLVTKEDIIERLPQLAEEFDYIIADGPAGLSEVTRAILCFADLAIFPCGPSVLDVRAAQDALDVNKQFQDIRKGLPRAVVLPNKLQMQYTLSKDLLRHVKEKMGMPVGEGLSLRQAYADAPGQGSLVWRMKGESARAATAELQLLFQQLLSYESTPSKHIRGGGATAHAAS